MRHIIAFFSLFLSAAFTVPVKAQEQCIQFPVGVGPEEVCATEFLPTGPFFVAPGEAFVLEINVTFSNNTDRDMLFTVEAAGAVVPPGEGLIILETLAPGEQKTFNESLALIADASTPQRTEIPFVLGWGATGSLPGEDDYVVSVEQSFRYFALGPDSDGDGLTDEEEIFGYDSDGDGVVDVNLPAMGADPQHKDIFFEIDWEVGAQIFKSSIALAKDAYARAPIDAGGVANPDGQPGINLWVDTGGLRDESGDLVGDDLGGGNQVPSANLGFDNDYYAVKAVNFDPARAPIFHYALVDADFEGAQGELGGNDIRMGIALSGQQAYEIFHELGHNLYLSHGGNPAEAGIRNCEPNYVSSMNYRYNYIRGIGSSAILDFAPARLSNGNRVTVPIENLQEGDLDETRALDPTDTEHFISYAGPPEECVAVCSGGPRDDNRCAEDADCADPDDPLSNGVCMGSVEAQSSCTVDANCGGGRCSGLDKLAQANVPIDFNEDGTLSPSISQTIDGNYRAGACGNENFARELTTLTAWDDWSNIRLRFIQFGDFADGALNVVEEELDPDELTRYLEETSTTDLKISKTGPAGPIEAGSNVILDYTIEVENLGPYPASLVSVRDDLPAGFELQSASSNCSIESTDTIGCDLGGILVGDTANISVVVNGDALCSMGAPQAIVNLVRVSNDSDFAGEHPVPENAVAMWETEVIDSTAPALTVELTPGSAWPPNHKFVNVIAEVTATDACDAAPEIRLVSIVSNEPENGTGDGSTRPDVQGAETGSDDRQFRLRAERNGDGSGRVYTITYEAEDVSGNIGLGTAIFEVSKP